MRKGYFNYFGANNRLEKKIEMQNDETQSTNKQDTPVIKIEFNKPSNQKEEKETEETEETQDVEMQEKQIPCQIHAVYNPPFLHATISLETAVETPIPLTIPSSTITNSNTITSSLTFTSYYSNQRQWYPHSPNLLPTITVLVPTPYTIVPSQTAVKQTATHKLYTSEKSFQIIKSSRKFNVKGVQIYNCNKHTASLLVGVLEYMYALLGTSKGFDIVFSDEIRESENVVVIASECITYSDSIDVFYKLIFAAAQGIARVVGGLQSKTFADEWVVRAISRYVALLYMQKRVGHNEFMVRIKRDMQRVAALDVVQPPLHWESGDSHFRALKGALVLYMLDKKVFLL